MHYTWDAFPKSNLRDYSLPSQRQGIVFMSITLREIRLRFLVCAAPSFGGLI
ncbi:hypothetical protein ANAPH2_00300 [Anaplasma phagocytophilum]|nr:hypothetical protein ANAPH2_00300 [Anaplasma phagocytophilum]